jgi:hypothetical protein
MSTDRSLTARHADDGIIVAIVERFDSLIGLWPDDSEAQ